VLDLKVEIASLAWEMPSGIQQYQIVEPGLPKGSRHLEAMGRINPNAVTPEDASARVAGGLVGIDEENLLVIENRAATKWWWLVHPIRPKPERVCGRLGRILLPAGGEVKANGKAPRASRGFLFLSMKLGYSRRLPVSILPAAEFFIGAWRPFHAPVGAGSCALPASA
jgi:hypothetical protein